MTKIAVVYHSVGGTAEALAGAVVSGAAGCAGTEAAGLKVAGGEIHRGRYHNPALLEQLDAADGIVFASPTFMGSVSAQFKAFMDATSPRWGERRWRDKLAAGVTTGSSASGDQLNTMRLALRLSATRESGAVA